MKRMLIVLLLSFGLVLVWSMVIAEDGFYLIPVKKNNYAPVSKTGQTTCYDDSGTVIVCSGAGEA